MGNPVRPSGYIAWGSTGATNIAEPLDSKKAVGWSIGEKPASSYFNWLLAKQDEWIQYFDWRGQLRPVVRDDFVRPTGMTGNTGFVGRWNAPVNAGLSYDEMGATRFPQAGGTVYEFVAVDPGVGRLDVPVGAIGDRDYSMEMVRRVMTGGGSGAVMEFGMIGLVGLVRTGMSGAGGLWAIRYIPSGGGATSVTLASGLFVSPSRYYVAALERRGPTLAAYIDGVLAGAAPGVALATPTGASSGVNFGFASLNRGGQIESHVSSMELKIAE